MMVMGGSSMPKADYLSFLLFLLIFYFVPPFPIESVFTLSKYTKLLARV